MTGLAFGVIGLLVGAAVGVVVGYRRGERATWLNAATAFLVLDRIVFRQLCDAERELAWRREVDHAEARNPHGWGNGAGYQSRRHDFPSRPSSEVSNASA